MPEPSPPSTASASTFLPGVAACGPLAYVARMDQQGRAMPREGFKQVDPAAYCDWRNSAWGQKSADVTARPVAEGTQVETVMKDGHKETAQVVKGADFYLVTNPGGEEYAVSGNKLLSRYEPVPGAPNTFRPVFAPVEFVPVAEDVSFAASWGEEMFIRAGGVVVKEAGSQSGFYGIQAAEFASTYGLTTAAGARRPATLDAMREAAMRRCPPNTPTPSPAP